jgi:hypothetical protein
MKTNKPSLKGRIIERAVTAVDGNSILVIYGQILRVKRCKKGRRRMYFIFFFGLLGFPPSHWFEASEVRVLNEDEVTLLILAGDLCLKDAPLNIA